MKESSQYIITTQQNAQHSVESSALNHQRIQAENKHLRVSKARAHPTIDTIYRAAAGAQQRPAQLRRSATGTQGFQPPTAVE
jgi:hypothetical protein